MDLISEQIRTGHSETILCGKFYTAYGTGTPSLKFPKKFQKTRRIRHIHMSWDFEYKTNN